MRIVRALQGKGVHAAGFLGALRHAESLGHDAVFPGEERRCIVRGDVAKERAHG